MAYFVDRVVAITGAGSGIGRALALAVAAGGALLALSDKAGEAVAEKVLVGLDALLVDLVTRIAGSAHERVLDVVFRS